MNSTKTEGESIECYLTITSVPALNGCRDCHRIAQSYGDEDLAANWDSCVRFSCLRHGWTIHSSYTTVLPYPATISPVPLRNDDTIVINTANFLHVLTVQVEFPPATDPCTVDDPILDLQPTQPEWDESSERSERSFSNVRSTSSIATPTRSVSTPNMSPSGYRKWIGSPIAADQPAESEYDFMEAEELPRETISAFRKRRLADKKVLKI